ncbi:MAG TPA: alkaline phosphatase family protein, partial [Thermoleophilia bacterium]|nr:alkaline phosphatase family protein [Thermoleophilia bacterium]
MTRPRRVLLIGFDAAVPARWRALVESGALPVGRRLLAGGRLVPCLPALPTLTTTNWATIATGALPGTHGVTDFNPHRLGDVPDQSLQGFDARDTRAEFVWEAAVRGGLDSAVVNWPGSWPPREWPVERSGDGDVAPGRLTIVGGAGIELNEWRVGIPGRDRLVALAAEQRFSTDPDERAATLVRLPLGDEHLALPFSYGASFSPVSTAVTLECSVVERAGRPAARFWLQGADEALAELATGEWSERLTLPFEADGEIVPGTFRMKLLALDPR